MTDNPLLNLFGDDAFAEDQDACPAAQPAQVPHIDVAALRRRAEARPPEEVSCIVEEIDRLTFAQDALDMGRDQREFGDFDRARHWLTVAAAYGAPDAEAELANTTALQEVFAAISASDTSATCDPPETSGGAWSTRGREILRKAVDVLEEARRVAGETLSRAEKKAAHITSAAEFRVLLATGLGSGQSAFTGDSSSASAMALLSHFGDTQVREIVDAALDALPRRGADMDVCDRLVAEAVEPMATRAAINTWMATYDQCTRTFLRCDAYERRSKSPTRWHAPNFRAEPTAAPWILPSALPGLRDPAVPPNRLFSPLWNLSRADLFLKPREQITPGPKLRKALKRLSTRTPPVDAAMAAAG